MKTSPLASLTCRLVRWRIDVYHGNPRTSGHVSRCPNCQAYFAFAEEMERTARRSAPAWRPNISADLQRRAQEIRERPRQQAHHGWSIPFMAWSGGVAVAALVLAWLVWAPADRPMKLVPETAETQRTVMAIARQNAAIPASLLDGAAEPGVPAHDGPVNGAALQQATVDRLATLLSTSFGGSPATRSRSKPAG